jgi:4-alpha-glucanotransferase
MTEWVLPPDETPVFVELLENARAHDDVAARFLRGGFWRNFAAKYREINELHKQMLRVSAKVDAMPEGPAKQAACDHLYQGQSNDCYWHGLFGGIYIVHMRMATLAHLIAAEDIVDSFAAANGGKPYGARLFDTDLDAIDEALLSSPGQTIAVDLNEGAGISSWDLRASRVALASVLRRRPEAYHARLIEHEQEDSAAGRADARAAASGGPKTIHDIVSVKEPGLSKILHYDDHERRSGIVHLLPAGGGTTAAQFVSAGYRELGDFVESAYETDSLEANRLVARRVGTFQSPTGDRPLIVEKAYRFDGDRSKPKLELAVTVENPGEWPLEFELATEWNLDLLGGGHNPAAYYEVGADRTAHDVGGELLDTRGIAFGNDYEGVRIEARAEPDARLTWFPVETVSNSEAGFERSYQGSCMLFRWPVSLARGERRTFKVAFDVAQTRDRMAEEGS